MFIKKGFYVKVDKDLDEDDIYYHQRVWFILSQKPKTKKELEETIKFSRIWINHKKFNCCYSSNLMDKLEELEVNIWNK
ncbi:MAG: hypothetical protein CMF62_02940 [Magnetococcales bacterium]|nr:hypothetical protein [Magnetococcales bacterium]|tara:strand:+ start:1070 stop:1306 length:237 start_codon:yes stop_codon:yes gene_type:complete